MRTEKVLYFEAATPRLVAIQLPVSTVHLLEKVTGAQLGVEGCVCGGGILCHSF